MVNIIKGLTQVDKYSKNMFFPFQSFFNAELHVLQMKRLGDIVVGTDLQVMYMNERFPCTVVGTGSAFDADDSRLKS